MLYQTLPLFSLLNPFLCSSSSPLPSPCQENSMDCVANKALKTSFWPENVLKQTQQVFVEDFWSGNGGNGVSGDDLFVDGLLDFSNEDGDKGLVENEQVEDEKHEKVYLEEQEEFQSNNSNSSLEFGSSLLNPPSEELSVPVEEVENLEWLSHFVDDSFSEFSLQIPVEQKLQVPKQNRSEPEPPVNKTSFLSSVPAKARSKRSRTGGRVWSMGSLPLTDSSCSASSSSSYSSSSSSSCLIFDQTGSGTGSGSGREFEMFTYLEKPPKPKKKRKGPIPDTQPRRCSHCGVNKTPQWRTGPMGAKTLCNACGVRYKSGRLLPEYRPACSPTFSSEVHSNNHRKVLEMRRMKESSTMGHFQPVAPGLNFRY